MHLQTFIDHLQYEKRHSAHTVEAYQSDLAQFSAYLLGEFEIDNLNEATAPMLRAWLIYLLESGLKPRSVNRKIASLRTYYRFAQRRGWCSMNPTGKITPPKTEKRLPVFASEQSLAQLLDHPELFPDGWQGKQDRLILLVFYFTGIRLSELIGLRVGDVDRQLGQIKVLGKGNKERIIPIPEVLLEDISEMVEARRSFLSETSGYVFVTKKGTKLYPRLVYGLVNSYLSKVSSLHKRSPHVLRHSFATHLLNHGADLNTIKELLGHANLSATQVYTHNSTAKLKAVHGRTHPKA